MPQQITISFGPEKKNVSVAALAALARKRYIVDDTIVEIDGRPCRFGDIADQVAQGRAYIEGVAPPEESEGEVKEDPFAFADLDELLGVTSEEKREPSVAINLAIVILVGAALAFCCFSFWKSGERDVRARDAAAGNSANAFSAAPEETFVDGRFYEPTSVVFRNDSAV